MNPLFIAAARQRILQNESGVLSYQGTLAAEALITSASLVSLVGLTAGNAASHNGWIHFKRGRKNFYLSMGARRSNITWKELDDRGLIFGREILIDGKRYNCRSMKGAGVNPTTGVIGANEGEFNELVYSICTSRPAAYTGPILANLGRVLLGFETTAGHMVFCQESRDGSFGRLRRNTTRGNIATASFASETYRETGQGWWPLIEEI
jgi:hypothetical protein